MHFQFYRLIFFSYCGAESYEELLAGLEDICEKAKDLNVITISGKVYNTVLYLGGDWKFLATVCGIESATSEFACIWCKYPKEKRFDMALEMVPYQFDKWC